MASPPRTIHTSCSFAAVAGADGPRIRGCEDLHRRPRHAVRRFAGRRVRSPDPHRARDCDWRNSDTGTRAFALLEKALASRPDDEGLLRVRAKLHALTRRVGSGHGRSRPHVQGRTSRPCPAGSWADLGCRSLSARRARSWRPVWPGRCRRNRIRTRAQPVVGADGKTTSRMEAGPPRRRRRRRPDGAFVGERK